LLCSATRCVHAFRKRMRSSHKAAYFGDAGAVAAGCWKSFTAFIADL
jgi:hypothetical protein